MKKIGVVLLLVTLSLLFSINFISAGWLTGNMIQVEEIIPPEPGPLETPTVPSGGGSSYPSTPLELVAHYSFDNKDARDSAGSNTGILKGSPEFVVGKNAYALKLDGNDDYISVADSDSLDLTDSFSFSVWAKKEGLHDAKTLISKDGEGSDPHYAYNLYYYSNTISYESNNVDSMKYPLPDPSQAQEWNYITVTYADENMKMYFNGELVKNETIIAPTVNSKNLMIGRRGYGDYFNGTIDELRIYKGELTEREVYDLYKMPLGGIGGSGSDANVTVSYCSDSDNGDYYINGITTDSRDGGVEGYDVCFGNLLSESKCQDLGLPHDIVHEDYFCPNGCVDGACVKGGDDNLTFGSCTDLLALAKEGNNDNNDLEIAIDIDGEEWTIDYTYSSDDYKYLSFVGYDDYSYRRLWLSANDMSNDYYMQVNELLDELVNDNLCEIESIYVGEDEQQVYLCQNPWDTAYEQNELDTQERRRVTVFWVKDETLFEAGFYVNYWDNCWDDESCLRNEVYEIRDNQREVASFLEKIISNDHSNYVPIYLDWNERRALSWILDRCDSEVKVVDDDISYGSWQCKVEPAICPSHGKQTQTCTRYNHENYEDSKVVTTDIHCNPGICSGCMVPRWFEYGNNDRMNNDNICLPYGARFQQDGDWSIGIITEDVDSYDVDSLTVEEAERNGELNLTVYPNQTAILIAPDTDMAASLEIGEILILPSDDYFGESVTTTMTVDNIVYDKINYDNSYIEVTFHSEGTRTYEEITEESSLNLYCAYSGKIEQQKTRDFGGNWAKCQENFECDSNFCSSGECIEIKDMLNEISGFKSMGIKVLCSFANMFGIQDYEECIAENLGA